MTKLQDKLEVQRNYVVQLLKQLTTDYQNTKPEWKEIAEKYPGSEQEFAPLEELELLTASIRGYASQVEATGGIKNCEQAIAQLQMLKVFDNPAIAQFYGEAPSCYPLMQSYLQMLDYLRLLVLEYLQMQQSVQPISV